MGKNSKFLLIALPLAIVLFGLTIYEYGYRKVRSEVAALDESALEKRKILKKYLAVIAEKPLIEEKIAALSAARKEERKKIIEGQTPAIASASLQNTVKDLIVLHGGTVSSERIEKPEELGKFKVITISVDALLPDIRALSETLYSLETQMPSVVVRELDASLRNLQAPKELTIRLKLSGLTGGT